MIPRNSRRLGRRHWDQPLLYIWKLSRRSLMENFSNKVRRRKLYLPRNDNVSPVCNSWNYATSYALHTLGMRGTIESRSILSWNSQLIQVLFNRFFSWLPLFFKKNCVVHANQKALRVIYSRWTFNLLTRSTAPTGKVWAAEPISFQYHWTFNGRGSADVALTFRTVMIVILASVGETSPH